jgi:hypothetical protein
LVEDSCCRYLKLISVAGAGSIHHQLPVTDLTVNHISYLYAMMFPANPALPHFQN